MSAPCSRVWCFGLPEQPSTMHDRFEEHDLITWSRRRQFRQHIFSFARRTRSIGDIERKSSHLKIFVHDSLPQAKQDEVSNAGLLFLAGVEVAKIGRWRSWRWFTGLDDTLTGSCCGWSFFDACSAIYALRSLMSATLGGWCWERSYSMASHRSCLWRGNLVTRWARMACDLSSATCPMATNVLMTLETFRKRLRRAERFSVGTDGRFMNSWMWARATRCGRL